MGRGQIHAITCLEGVSSWKRHRFKAAFMPSPTMDRLAENLCALTNAGREDHTALLNARVSEISPGPEGMEVVLADVDPEELARFNRALEAFEAAGPTM